MTEDKVRYFFFLHRLDALLQADDDAIRVQLEFLRLSPHARRVKRIVVVLQEEAIVHGDRGSRGNDSEGFETGRF